jgi:hypothetical protein
MNALTLDYRLKALLPVLALAGLLGLSPAVAQTTAFNFNGRLSNLGLPVNGLHDMRFAVYGSPGGADLVAGPITVSPVAVRNGIFNCRLDFGEQVFNGSGRWLDISVRPFGAAVFTNLSPRIELTSAPYAVRAREAAVAASVADGSAVRSLNNLKDNVTLAAGPNVSITSDGNALVIGSTGGGGSSWSTLGTNTYFDTGNVGVGTNQPQGLVDIHSGGADRSALYVRADPSVGSRGGIIHHQSATYGWQEVAQGTGSDIAGSLAFHYVNRTAPATKISSNVLTLQAGGNVGVKGNITAGGDAVQSREKGGWVKATVKVNANGTIARQFCAPGGEITIESFPVEGVTAYVLTFPFQIDDRYITIEAIWDGSLQQIVFPSYAVSGPNSIIVKMAAYRRLTNEWLWNLISNDFVVVVY